jgi:hypothetical protein
MLNSLLDTRQVRGAARRRAAQPHEAEFRILKRNLLAGEGCVSQCRGVAQIRAGELPETNVSPTNRAIDASQILKMANTRHQVPCLSHALMAACRSFLQDLFDPYRPELHYMRGPGPKWRAKHGSPQQRATPDMSPFGSSGECRATGPCACH